MKKLDRIISNAVKILGSAVAISSKILLEENFSGTIGQIVAGSTERFVWALYKKVGEDISERFLSKQQETRIGITFVTSINKINENIENNVKLRNDDFFKNNLENRSAAEEILEAVLFLAKDEYEELKLKHLGKFIANLAFHQEIDRQYANFSLKIIREITFRQFCLIHIFSNQNKYELFTTKNVKKVSKKVSLDFIENVINVGDISRVKNYRPKLLERKIDLKLEINELVRYGIINKREVFEYNERFDIYRSTEFGKMLFDLLELEDLSNEFINPIIKELKFVEERFA